MYNTSKAVVSGQFTEEVAEEVKNGRCGCDKLAGRKADLEGTPPVKLPSVSPNPAILRQWYPHYFHGRNPSIGRPHLSLKESWWLARNARIERYGRPMHGISHKLGNQRLHLENMCICTVIAPQQILISGIYRTGADPSTRLTPPKECTSLPLGESSLPLRGKHLMSGIKRTGTAPSSRSYTPVDGSYL